MREATVIAISGVCGLGLLQSCGKAGRDDDLFGDGDGSASATTGASASAGDADGDSAGSAEASATTPTSADASAGSDGGVKLDVGDGMSSADDGGDAGCDKVDFLFVIDNSGSMTDEQTNVIASFPEFIGAIQQQLQAQDYHIMVVSTDDGTGGGSSIMCINGDCSCTPVPACCQMVCDQFSQTCNGFDCNNLPGGDCETTLGAGKIFESDGTSCLPENGPRWMAQDQPDLAGTFSCAAHVGTYGSGDEKPMEAMLAASSPPLNAPGACDDGFLRDDAILVVVFITDEEDIDKSPGNPPDWHDGLLANKGNNPDAVAVLGLFGDGHNPNGICPPLQDDVGAEPSPRLQEFVDSFGARGVAGSICANDYIPFFLDAVDVIDTTCDDFRPEG